MNRLDKIRKQFFTQIIFGKSTLPVSDIAFLLELITLFAEPYVTDSGMNGVLDNLVQKADLTVGT